MKRSLGVLAAAAGLAGTVAALILPWMYHGGVSFSLYDLPRWGQYLAGAVAVHALTGVAVVVGNHRVRRVVMVAGLTAAAITLVAALAVMVRGDEAITGPVLPPIAPELGIGGPVAIAAVLVSAAALVALLLPRPER